MRRLRLRSSFVFIIYSAIVSFFLLTLITQVGQSDNWSWNSAADNGKIQDSEEQPSEDESKRKPLLAESESVGWMNRKLVVETNSTLKDLFNSINEKLWFFENGTYRPEIGDLYDPVWPCPSCGSRIAEQLMIGPPEAEEPKVKTIFLGNGLGAWSGMRAGAGVFIKSQCPVSSCSLSGRKSDALTADAILFKDSFIFPKHKKPLNQVWIMYMLESPLNTPRVKYQNVINWTATYRMDSDVMAPYESWQYYNPEIKSLPQTVNFAANKTKKVAWFVSNCAAKNNRLEYAKELQKHFEVDIYGGCGTKTCPRKNKDCFAMLQKDYKFYLAFENSNCRDYITEKFFVNGLMNGILPIVMGAPKEDYEKAAPANSFIHVDDYSSPKELAEYLKALDADDSLYNKHFEWRGTGEFINTYFWCRLCAMLHLNPLPEKVYTDYDEWWKGKLSCTSKPWRDLPEYKKSSLQKPKR
ncbi:glycoprotein 3-alpha-L-fucosyltransferase A-like [Artemia franciscana]|uniref:glycoprotein 3-alpha-L-fucosyltransferase A-like n=1 Tax=Artemia franciscana TaxID=6661 RepID=UPI0032D9C3E7